LPGNSSPWPYPGKVLIIDDEYDELIKDASDQLLKNGVPVGYWNGRNRKTILSNTRVVLLDLILSRKDANMSGPEKFDRAIKAISRIRGASIVIIFSNTTDDPADFEEAYSRKKGRFPGVIAQQKMQKDNLKNPNELINLIERSVKEHPEVRLALLLESVIDSSKDGAFQSTLGHNVDVVASLVKIMERQAGKEGLRRELVDSLIRLLSRHAHSGQAYEELSGVLDEMLGKNPQVPASAALLSLLMYYQPHKEKVWTGDIFQTGKTDGRDIAIIITPACDLAFNKSGFVTVAFGFSLTKETLDNHKNILFRKDDTLRDLASEQEKVASTGGNIEAYENKIKKRIECYTDTGKFLPAWAHVLHHVDLKGNMLPVCLDLNDVERVPIEKLGNKRGRWKRIVRLDSPFIEALLQKFGGHLSRIGVPDVNFSLKMFTERAGSL